MALPKKGAELTGMPIKPKETQCHPKQLTDFLTQLVHWITKFLTFICFYIFDFNSYVNYELWQYIFLKVH
jgi:hypothetical protein